MLSEESGNRARIWFKIHGRTTAKQRIWKHIRSKKNLETEQESGLRSTEEHQKQNRGTSTERTGEEEEIHRRRRRQR